MVEPLGTGSGPEVALIETLTTHRANRTPVIYAVNTATWDRNLITDNAKGAAAQARLTDKSGFDGDWFLGVHNPPLRMIVVGAVHIAQPLLVMAREAGYDTMLIDPREAFGAQHRFPGQTISNDWPDAAMTTMGIDARTAVITLSHDPKIDDPALETALASGAFYIGALGSTRTHAKRIARLTETGLTGLDRIHSPIGADIGSRSPAEIAISIMAQVTERLRRPDTRP